MNKHDLTEYNPFTVPVPSFPLTAASKIRGWRERMGITQEALAYKLDVCCSTVNRWENAHSIPSRLAWKRMEEIGQKCNMPIEH